MKLSLSSKSHCIFCCSDALLICSKRSNEWLFTFINLLEEEANLSTARNQNEDSSNNGSENTASKCGPEEALEKEIVTGCCISSCEQFLAAITSHKKLLVWQAVNSSWQLQRSWSLIKRPVDLIFDSSSDHVLVAGAFMIVHSNLLVGTFVLLK
ncbi:uncharacterized protein LOC108675364 [Hyalella azteca]|uniref:Uncharacterized protein LOC108675364 n=1 Tax=Hyalella azteca TaxID=294128 RepID=A0A8B7P1A1_HYAAZ|nr:uncharacterized protein LOC108675364 [Hyalella azteca]